MSPLRSGAPSMVMSSGPSGVLLGAGLSGPVTVRLFRTSPTRVYFSAPEWVKWLITFRAMCVGAHISVISAEHRPWLGLAATIRNCGGTFDLLRSSADVPEQGRPYRPSLIVDELGAGDSQMEMGPWQALIRVAGVDESVSFDDLSNYDMAIMAPVEARTLDILHRTYELTAHQMMRAAKLQESDVVCASARQLVKVSMPPSQTEYQLMFDA